MLRALASRLGELLSPDIETGNLLSPVMLGASGTHFPILTLRRSGDPSSGPVVFSSPDLLATSSAPVLN